MSSEKGKKLSKDEFEIVHVFEVINSSGYTGVHVF
jgi:hypothetical protein